MDKQSDIAFYTLLDEILWKDWDPIGVYSAGDAARDEYHSYLPIVYELVKQHKSNQEISDYLFSVETERMGLPGNNAKCDQIAQLIIGKYTSISKQPSVL